jgi:hypothetical protein
LHPDLLERDSKKYKIYNNCVSDAKLKNFCLQNAILHNLVRVGDRLIIGNCVFHQSHVNNVKFYPPFRSQLLNIEIKVDKYSIRNVTHIPLSIIVNQQKNFPKLSVRLPKFVIEGPSMDGKLLTTSDILLNIEKERNVPFYRREKYTFSAIGMISHVGRIERQKSIHCTVACPQDPEETAWPNRYDLCSVTQYEAYRWIQMIDDKSKPLTYATCFIPTCILLDGQHVCCSCQICKQQAVVGFRIRIGIRSETADAQEQLVPGEYGTMVTKML